MYDKTVVGKPLILNNEKKKTFKLGHDFRTQFELGIMLWPSILHIFIFVIIPLFGYIIAFKDYDPTSGVAGIFSSAWNGWNNFMIMFNSYDFIPMLRNTIGMNLLASFVSIPVTLFFALFLNEITSSKFKSFVQTATYLPHFISWVIYGGLFVTLLRSDGAVNYILKQFHLVNKPIPFLSDPSYFWGIATVTSLLKDLGWGAILYLAAIAGVDMALYESATIDGAGRFKKMFYITIPCIKPTLMIMIIFAVSGILNNNFTQIYVFQNSLNLPTSQVIDTYVYQFGLQQLQFNVATAIQLMKSVFALILLWGANSLSKKMTQSGLF
ncbi:ABC transporter permease [Paenibacillus sp. Soil522]|uniref:ABC transporter permease n=1 Tax=Paenibacillus sp. Soil522 TaxID=1736388 RepID=UPI0006F6F85F|nr:ABC transporter permease subunit [Paenibacillus sp. Soil522]KRE34413.1 protein lplB [Paenibacillus sp. Soil522]